MLWKKLFAAPRIYADAAAATPLSRAVERELLRLLPVYGNAGALHSEALRAKSELEKARATIARVIGAHPDEIIFTASGTEGNNLAIDGVLRPLLHIHGELHAVSLPIEHQSVLEPLKALEREGLYTTLTPVDAFGLPAQPIREHINDETVFVSIQLVNSEIGTIEPVRDIARELRRVRKERKEKGNALPLYFHCDASQAPLWIELRVDALGVDLLTLDAQKVLGPKGVGVLFVRRQTEIESVIRGGVQEFGLRGGTPNVPLAGAFAVALAEAQTGVDARVKEVSAMRDLLCTTIKKSFPDLLLNGPLLGPDRVANNINISLPGLDGEMAVVALDAEGVAVSTRSACSAGDEEPSHVIKAIGVPKPLAKTAIRITLLPTITAAEVKIIARRFAAVAGRYRT